MDLKILEVLLPTLKKAGVNPEMLQDETGAFLEGDAMTAVLLPAIPKALNAFKTENIAQATRQALGTRQRALQTKYDLPSELETFEEVIDAVVSKVKQESVKTGEFNINDLTPDMVVKNQTVVDFFKKANQDEVIALRTQLSESTNKYTHFVAEIERKEKMKAVMALAKRDFLAENPSGLPTDLTKRDEYVEEFLKGRVILDRAKIVRDALGVEQLLEVNEDGQEIYDVMALGSKKMISSIKPQYYHPYNAAPDVGGAPAPKSTGSPVMGHGGMSDTTHVKMKAFYEQRISATDFANYLGTLTAGEQQSAQNYMREQGRGK